MHPSVWLKRQTGAILLVALLVTTIFSYAAPSAQAAPPPLDLNTKAAILIDGATGQVLLEKNADAVLSPASLTKLMTLHLVYKKIDEGAIKPDDKVTIRPDAWAKNWPGSSLMFLEPGQNVTVWELMQGLAIPSGNDAAIALADHIAGNVGAFVALMNKEARDLGYKVMTFADPAGLSPDNKVTAREYADFARRYIEMHPKALAELHNKSEFSYPLAKNLPANKTLADSPTIRQYNRNRLLGVVEGVDGLKTGFIDEAGYNFAVTAKRGDMRLIGVILGTPGATPEQGEARRAEQGAALMEWGFTNFVTAKPAVPALKAVRVWKGAANEVTLVPEKPVLLTVEQGMQNKLTPTVHQEESVIAPVAKGAVMGELIYSADGKEVVRYKLVAANEVKQGGFFKRLWDTVRLTVMGWLNKK